MNGRSLSASLSILLLGLSPLVAQEANTLEPDAKSANPAANTDVGRSRTSVPLSKDLTGAAPIESADQTVEETRTPAETSVVPAAARPRGRYWWHMNHWWYSTTDYRWYYWENNRWARYFPPLYATQSPGYGSLGDLGASNTVIGGGGFGAGASASSEIGTVITTPSPTGGGTGTITVRPGPLNTGNTNPATNFPNTGNTNPGGP